MYMVVEPVNNLKLTDRFGNCSMDLITDLPPADGFDSILVMVILIPCNKMITTEETGKLLLKNIYKQFGLPIQIEAPKPLGITSALPTAYHPQTDGTTKRVNQEI